MGKKRIHTVTEIVRTPTLLRRDIPFDITSNGKVICTVVRPGGVWRECENCGENTKNILEFRSKGGNWTKIILCDKCSDKLI